MRRFEREYRRSKGSGWAPFEPILYASWLDYVRWLERELDRARRAALALLVACEAADEAGELDLRIGGDLLDACKALDPARKAKGAKK